MTAVHLSGSGVHEGPGCGRLVTSVLLNNLMLMALNLVAPLPEISFMPLVHGRRP